MTKRSDGRYMTSRRINGSRIYGYGRTAEEAEADLAAKTFIPSTSDPYDLHEFAKSSWYPIIENRAELTKLKYKGLYRKWIRSHWKGTDIRTIKFTHVQEWLNWMKTQGAGEQTIRYVRTMASGIFELAADLEIINRNPCASKRIVVPKKTPKRIRVISPEKAIAVLEGERETNLSAPVFLALALGLRRGEIAAVKWKHLDKETGILRIEEQLQAIPGKGVVTKPPKSDSTGAYYLTPAMIDELEARGDLDSGYICTRQGKPWVPQRIFKDWEIARKKYGLETWTLHDLRHGATSLYIETGSDMFQVQKVLRHKNVDMSLTYAARDEKSHRLSLENLSRRLLTHHPSDSRNDSQEGIR